MKKYFIWPVLAAILSAAVLRDPFAGPVIGLGTGLIIGLPAYYISYGILELFIKHKGTLPSKIGVYISVLLVILFHWFMYKPPGWFLFSIKLAHPIPDSVSHLRSKSCFVGPDGSQYLWFNISKDDLNKIVQDNGYLPVKEYELNYQNGRLHIDLSSSDNSFHFSLSGPWFDKIKEMSNPEVFTRGNIRNSGGTLEYLIYDPNQNIAFYELSTM